MDGDETSILKEARDADNELERALKLGELAATVGFDWGSVEEAMEKVEEEVGELIEALERDVQDEIESELGDLLFAVVNVARKTGVDPRNALRRTHDKFEQRFASIEAWVAAGERGWEAVSLAEMEERWQAAKSPGDE